MKANGEDIELNTTHSKFLEITCSRYARMKQRFEMRTNKKGKVIDPRRVPFSLNDYRGWIVEKLGGEQGEVRCEYCGHWLTLETLQSEHRIPPFRGGSLDFDNLAVSCAQCNQQKGGLSYGAFLELLTVVNRFIDPIDRTDVLARLQRSGRFMGLARTGALGGSRKRRSQSVRLSPVSAIREPRP